MGSFPFTGALFDLDGTLIDSEPQLYRAWVETLDRRGHNFAAFDHSLILGLPDHNAAEVVLKHFGLSEDIAAFYAEWKTLAESLVDRHAAPCAGAREMLDRFAAEQMAMGVATSSPTSYMNRMLAKCGFERYFLACRSVDSIGRERGKPKPDIYLEAAKDIFSPPATTLGFEDAPAGIASLKAAGMFAVGIAADPRVAKKLAAEGADVVVPSLLNFDYTLIHA